MAVAPIAIVLVFAPPVFVVIRNLTQDAEANVEATLAKRADRVHLTMFEDELYLSEAAQFGANVEGVRAAVLSRDSQSARRALTTALSVRSRLDVLAVTDSAGRSVAQFVRSLSSSTGPWQDAEGTDWSHVPIVIDMLRSRGAGYDDIALSGFIRRPDGRTTLVSATRITRGSSLIGVAIAGIDVRTVLSSLRATTGGPVALYDPAGRELGRSGLIPRSPPPPGRELRRFSSDQSDISVLFEPTAMGGRNIGMVALAVDRRPVFAAAHAVTHDLQLFFALAVLVGIIALYFLTRFMLMQLRELVRTNAALRGGDLSARSAVLAKDEVGGLAAGINAMAADLERIHSDLEGLVAHRTRKLHAAREEARRATEAKAAFVANMSHEIRTPMNAIVGITSLLATTKLSREQREYVETVRGSGHHLLAIVNDVLDFSKIEAGRLELEELAFSVRGTIEAILDLEALHAQERGVELLYSMDDDVPDSIVSDVGRVRQVLLNLVSNAVKFSEDGNVHVHVGVERVRGAKTELRFSVRDSGIGIAKNQLIKVFGVFNQADARVSRLYGGTGLGLAVSKRLVELMGGKIWAESTLGEGSTFSFTLTAAPGALHTPDPDLDMTALAGRRVLVVGDNAQTQKVLMDWFKRWDVAAVAAASGGESLRLLATDDAFDAGVVDLKMQKLSTRLADDMIEAGHAFPLVLLTGVRSPSRTETTRFAAIARKPIKPARLYAAIVRATSNELPRSVRRAATTLDGTMGSRHPLRVLVAEDNVVNQKVIRAILQKLGYDADVASDGDAAVDAVSRGSYDLVFMDVQMPGRDGLEATKKIVSSMPSGTRPRIVALTATATAEDRQKCLAAGMDDYATKPLTPEKLVEHLARAVPVGDGDTDRGRASAGRVRA